MRLETSTTWEQWGHRGLHGIPRGCFDVMVDEEAKRLVIQPKPIDTIAGRAYYWAPNGQLCRKQAIQAGILFDIEVIFDVEGAPPLSQTHVPMFVKRHV